MENRKLQKKARTVKTVETYAATPTCSTCDIICNMTSADVYTDARFYLRDHTGRMN